MYKILGSFRGICREFLPQEEENALVYRIPYQEVCGGDSVSLHLCFLDAAAGGGVGSGGGYDFAMEELDFALYVAYNLLSNTPRLADEIIPLWQLVYNGYSLSNP